MQLLNMLLQIGRDTEYQTKFAKWHTVPTTKSIEHI